MRKNPQAKWVLPSEINPAQRRCVMIEIPNERFHVAAFLGALQSLASAYKWQDDAAHTAKQVALVWRDIVDNIRDCSGQRLEIGIDESDYEMAICEQLRFYNGKLQGYCCGQWTDIDGQQGGLPLDSGTQPGAGGPGRPGAGLSATNCYALQANQQLLLPYVVYPGDTVEIVQAEGAGNDGTDATWYCPDGSQFFAGACVPNPILIGTDPLPTIDHMSIIFVVGASGYHAGMSGPYTISGSGPQSIALQVNDDALSANSGSYRVCVKITNNQTSDLWTHTFDFSLSSYGFTNLGFSWSNPTYEWIAGLGFSSVNSSTPGGDNNNAAMVKLAIPSSHITSMSMVFDMMKGSPAPSGTRCLAIGTDTYLDTENFDAVSNGDGQTKLWSHDDPSATNIYLEVINAYDSGTPPTPGTGNILSLTISGQGTNPFA